MSHVEVGKGELTVLQEDVELDPEHLPHEFTPGTDSFDCLMDCQIGNVEEFVSETDKGLEMENPYPVLTPRSHPHSLRPTKATFEKPEIPSHLINAAIRAKVDDVASQVDSLKDIIKKILLTNDTVSISVVRREETLTLPLDHPEFFKLLAYYLFANEMNYNTRLAVVYSKSGVVLQTEKRSVFELYTLFKLHSTVHDLRKKIAIHRQIASRLGSIKQRTENVRLKSSNSDSILRELDGAQELLSGFAQIYNTDAYAEVEKIRKEVAVHLRNDNLEQVIAV